MKRQFIIFAIIILVFSNVQAQPQKQNIQPSLLGEQLAFSMKYLNMKVASLEFFVSDSFKNLSKPQYQLSVKANSTPFATKLFKINNNYFRINNNFMV